MLGSEHERGSVLRRESIELADALGWLSALVGGACRASECFVLVVRDVESREHRDFVGLADFDDLPHQRIDFRVVDLLFVFHVFVSERLNQAAREQRP